MIFAARQRGFFERGVKNFALDCLGNRLLGEFRNPGSTGSLYVSTRTTNALYGGIELTELKLPNAEPKVADGAAPEEVVESCMTDTQRLAQSLQNTSEMPYDGLSFEHRRILDTLIAIRAVKAGYNDTGALVVRPLSLFERLMRGELFGVKGAVSRLAAGHRVAGIPAANRIAGLHFTAAADSGR